MVGYSHLVASVKKLDSKRRAVFPDRFSPGDLFLEQATEDGIVFQLIKPEQVPEAKVLDSDGRLFVDAPLDKSRIAKAIRQDRDSR